MQSLHYFTCEFSNAILLMSANLNPGFYVALKY